MGVDFGSLRSLSRRRGTCCLIDHYVKIRLVAQLVRSSDEMKNEFNNSEHDSDNPKTATSRVQLFGAGPLTFAVSREDVATIAHWRQPTSLPHAPESVLGVVSIQGRMLTVLDLVRLSGVNTPAMGESYTEIIALRGDEQLALAATAMGEAIDFSPADAVVETNGNERFVRGVFIHSSAEIRLLNISELFSAALHGRERRRRRF